MASTCYLCGELIQETDESADHVVPKALLERTQPKVKGFAYAGILPTHSRCNNLDLVEPTRVHRSVDRNQSRMGLRQASHASLAAMGRAVVHDPEHPTRLAVRPLTHDVVHQALERRDAGGRLAPAEHLGSVHVQRGQIGPGAAARVFVLHAHRLAGANGQARMHAQARLNAGLLVGGDDELVLAQRLALPAARVQIQDARGFGLEAGIARKYPAAVLPRPDRVLVQAAPHRAVTDARHQARALRVARDIGHAQARQRHAQRGRQLASQRLDLNGQLWGERPEGVPGGLALRGPPIALERSAGATG